MHGQEDTHDCCVQHSGQAGHHVFMADTAVHIGEAPPIESYLNMDKMIDAAIKSGSDAVHPGRGFLAGNDEFAKRVIDAGLLWIGPPPAVIKAAAGGGGRGMVKVDSEKQIHQAFSQASSEAKKAFGINRLLVEWKDPQGTLFFGIAVAVVSAYLIAFSHYGGKD